jgi:hypothetical protein
MGHFCSLKLNHLFSVGEYRGQCAEFLAGYPVKVCEYGEQTMNCSSDFARHGVALVGKTINHLQAVFTNNNSGNEQQFRELDNNSGNS